jgi:hypothetical protein
VIRRKTNRRHMTGDHHGRTARRATLLVTTTDEILGTHRREKHPPGRGRWRFAVAVTAGWPSGGGVNQAGRSSAPFCIVVQAAELVMITGRPEGMLARVCGGGGRP